MRKTILIFPFDLLSHYLRCLVLADEYDRDTYRILFQSSNKYNQHVKNHGYETFDAKHFNTEYVMQCSKNFDFSWLNEADLEPILLSQILSIKMYEPALVIGDVAPTLKMAAEFTGVKYISLLNGYLTKYYSETRKLSKAHPAYGYLNLLPPSVKNVLTAIGEKVAFKKVHQPFKNIRKAMKLKPVEDYLSETEGDLNYICDLPTLFPQLNLPENFVYKGPLIYENLAHEEWIDHLATEKPIICVTMGSSGDWNKLAFLNDSYFSKYTVVIAGYIGNAFNSPHLIVKNFVNLPQLVKKASLMICHGGNGTIYLGILSKIFLLCVADHFEQEWNVHALAQRKLGTLANSFTLDQWKTNIADGIDKSKNAVPSTLNKCLQSF